MRNPLKFKKMLIRPFSSLVLKIPAELMEVNLLPSHSMQCLPPEERPVHNHVHALVDPQGR